MMQCGGVWLGYRAYDNMPLQLGSTSRTRSFDGETMARGGVFWVLRNLCSLNGGEAGLYAPGSRVTTPDLGTLPLLGMV